MQFKESEAFVQNRILHSQVNHQIVNSQQSISQINPNRNILKPQIKSPLQELLSEFIPQYEQYVQRLDGEYILGYEAISELRDKDFPKGRSNYVDRILQQQNKHTSQGYIADENSFTESEIADEYQPDQIADENPSSEGSIQSEQYKVYHKPKQYNSKSFISSQLIEQFENLSIQPKKIEFPKQDSQINIFQDRDVRNIFSLNNSNYGLQPQPILKKPSKYKQKKVDRIVSFTEDNSLMLNNSLLNQTCLSLRNRKPKFDISTYVFDENEKIPRKLPNESRFPWNENPLRDAERLKDKYKSPSLQRLLNYIPCLYILQSEGSVRIAGDGMTLFGKVWRLKFDIQVKPNQHIGPTQIIGGSTLQIQVFGGNEIQVSQTMTVNMIIRDVLHLSNPSKKAVWVECELFFPL